MCFQCVIQVMCFPYAYNSERGLCFKENAGASVIVTCLKF